MKRRVPSREYQLRKHLYHSNLLRYDEIVAFKTVYLLLCQVHVNNRLERLKSHYSIIFSSYNRNPQIATLFHGILRSRGIKGRYKSDVIKLFGKPGCSVQILEKRFFESKDNK